MSLGDFSIVGKHHLFLILTDIYFNRNGDKTETVDYELSDRVPVLDVRDGVVETVAIQTLTSSEVFPYVCNLRGFFVDSDKVTVEKLLFGKLFTLSAWEETIGTFVVDSKKYKVILKDDSMITIDGVRCGIFGDNRVEQGAHELWAYSNDKRVPLMEFIDGVFFWSCLDLYYRVSETSVVLNYTVYTMSGTYETSEMRGITLLSLVYNIKTQKCLGYYIYNNTRQAVIVRNKDKILASLVKNILRG